MDVKQFNKVYDILVEMGGASESMRSSFIQNHLDEQFPCYEWRFMGKLGYGGKYRSRKNAVDCYSEDETPERMKLIEQINEVLQKI